MVVYIGALVNIIGENTFQNFGQNIRLQKCKTRIFAYGASETLPIIGKFEATLETKLKLTVADLHVVKGNNVCILSHETATNLGIVTVQVEQINSSRI